MNYKVEAFDIWQNLCKAVYEPLIRCKIDFSARIDVNTLIQAVTLSIQAVPLIGCCFDDSLNRPRWVEKSFTGRDMVRVIEAEDNVNEQITRLFSANIDFSKEPQMKVSLIRRANGDTLCVIISHIVCDGTGFKQYLYLLSKLYTNLKNNVEIPFPTLYPRGLQPLFTDIGLREKLRILCSRYDAYDSANKKDQQGVCFEENNREPHMEIRGISKEDFERLKSLARINNATVNDSLMALFARAFCKNTGIKKIMLPSTIDLRKFISAGVNFGISNYASNCMCRISVETEDSLTDTLKQVSEQMQMHKAGNSILKSVLLWAIAVHLLPYGLLKRNFTKLVTLPTISFTNLGILDQSLLHFDNLVVESVYLTASVKPSPYFQIAASTYNDCCTLSCNFYGSDSDKIWVASLLDDICAEIHALA